MKVWVLTRKHNEYDQHGEYFETLFTKQPSLQMLAAYFKDSSEYISLGDPFSAVEFLEHLREGGGRMEKEDVWYNLKVVDCL